jgi:hypothetical protein
MRRSAQLRPPIPRALHVGSVAFLLTVGLICGLVALSAPARFVNDPSGMPRDLSGWMFLIGMGLFPVLHWIGVYRRSIAASLLVSPLHAGVSIFCIMGAHMMLTDEPPGFAEGVLFAGVAGLELFLLGGVLWWARHLRLIRIGRIPPPPIVEPQRTHDAPEYIAVGKRGWLIERSNLAREMRSMDESVRRKARWFYPAWLIVRWPLKIMVWGGVVCASIVVPGMAVGFAAMIADGPGGIVFWTLTAIIASALIAFLSLTAMMFIRKLRETILDVDALVLIPLLLLGLLTVVLAAAGLRQGEWPLHMPQETDEHVEPARQ